MSHHQQGYPKSSLATLLYRLMLPAGLHSYIPYPNRAAVCRFELVVLPLLVHVKGPHEYITYEFVFTSPAVPCMSGWSNLDSFSDGW